MKKFLIILFLALTLNTNAFATRVSTFNEDSGYSYSGNVFAEFMALVIVLIPFALGFLWEVYKSGRPDKYNPYTGQKYYVPPKKKKSIFKKNSHPFKIYKMEVKKNKKRIKKH